MRQFDVLQNPNVETRPYPPFVIVLQSHHLDPLATIFLAPPVVDAERQMSSLDIAIEFQGRRLVLAEAEAAGVPRQGLGRSLGSVVEHEEEIRRAFDRLMTGF
ncbi:MAG: hypothetical protein JWP49_259 [Phenylobacterium sp.]|nr:hypothetical protein [Phenylobacterium sp.]